MLRTIVRGALVRLAADGITGSALWCRLLRDAPPSERLGAYMPLDGPAAMLGTYEVRFLVQAEGARLAA
ncbi:hypothetical protein FHY04_001248 [Sphingomonas sp. BK481]|jgi:GntR family transcriptional repressor for pyruvate dehydrogenase complex|nr:MULTISPECIES: hypothetical protein [unclassified Sphingomonas]MBB3586398.1 hypothetical protein [Sphingomonas sp. BK481]